jgi:hypothetical protein
VRVKPINFQTETLPKIQTEDGILTPAEYITEVVLPTVDEYLLARADLRRAVLACIVAWHVRDYLKKGLGLSLGEVDARIKALCRFSFDVLEGLANGSKHFRNDKGDFHFTPGDEKPVPIFAFDTPGAGWDEGRWDVPGLQIEHRGHRVFVDHCLCAVLGSFGRAFPAEFIGIDLDRYGAMVPGWKPTC